MEYTFAYENESQWTFAVPLDTATTVTTLTTATTITTTTIQETKQRNAARAIVLSRWNGGEICQPNGSHRQSQRQWQSPSPSKAKWGCSRRQISIQIVIKLTAQFVICVKNAQSSKLRALSMRHWGVYSRPWKSQWRLWARDFCDWPNSNSAANIENEIKIKLKLQTANWKQKKQFQYYHCMADRRR